MKVLIFILIVALNISACSSSVRYAATKNARKNLLNKQQRQSGSVIVGYSSYYGKKFHGKKTANGEIFDMYGKTAAHRNLPFGTRLRVTNLENGKSVIVRVNDRGPFVADRILDLSFGAAKEIGMIGSGVVKVNIKILKSGVDE